MSYRRGRHSFILLSLIIAIVVVFIIIARSIFSIFVLMLIVTISLYLEYLTIYLTKTTCSLSFFGFSISIPQQEKKTSIET